MKVSCVAFAFALAMVACQDSSDNSASATAGAPVPGRLGLGPPAEKASASARTQVPSSPAFSAVGRAASTISDAVTTGVGTDEAQSAADLLQNINASTASAMIIRTGQAFIEVEKVDPAVLKIRQLAAQVGGYIANSSISGGRDQIRQATLEMKIPAAKYDEAVGSLSSIGKVETVNSQAEDVGEEFVDVTARVTNARRLEERLITLLSTRTGKLDDVLHVERELARVREEIERYEGRLRYLGSRVATRTL